MAAISNCCNTCATVETVNVPGSEGDAGLDGVNGVNAFTTTVGQVNVPNPGDSVLVSVENSTWAVIGQIVIVGVGWDGQGSGPAHFRIAGIPSASSLTLEFLNYLGDLATGQPILTGSTVSPSA